MTLARPFRPLSKPDGEHNSFMGAAIVGEPTWKPGSEGDSPPTTSTRLLTENLKVYRVRDLRSAQVPPKPTCAYPGMSEDKSPPAPVAISPQCARPARGNNHGESCATDELQAASKNPLIKSNLNPSVVR